jgi:hypothetical protein
MNLTQINNDYNTGVKNLTMSTNKQLSSTYRMVGPAKKFLVNHIQNNYNQTLNQLITKRKSSLKQIGKLINYALIVGINYIGTNVELRGCINDATNIKEFVSARGCDKILMMTDKEPIKPTKNNILTGLRFLLSNIKDGESAMFYYSGHGTNVNDTTSDETDGKDECLFSLDGKTIIDDELNAIIKNNLKPNATLFILCDCCNSGTMFDLKYNYNEDTNTVKDIDQPGKVYYISGCRDSQISLESFIGNQTQGALTVAFTKSWVDTITWKDLMTSIRTKVSGQTPQLSTSKQIDINEKCPF